METIIHIHIERPALKSVVLEKKLNYANQAARAYDVAYIKINGDVFRDANELSRRLNFNFEDYGDLSGKYWKVPIIFKRRIHMCIALHPLNIIRVIVV